MTTKEKILTKALQQFNEEGTEVITTRHIAKALDISQGNLHYHYPTKDVVILMLFQQFLNEFEAVAVDAPTTLKANKSLLSQLESKFLVMYNFRFLMKDNDVIWRRLPNIKVALLALFEQDKTAFQSILEQSLKEGLFKKSIENEDLSRIANQYLFSLTSWLTAMEYFPISSHPAKTFAQMAIQNFVPYLNKKEAAKWGGLLAVDPK